MSDYGHEQTDKELKDLEKRLTKEYQNATKDLEKKFNGYMKDFARKDEQMKKLVDSGKMSEEDYLNWRRNQLIIGERWKDMYNTLAKDLANVDQIAAGMINETLPSVYALNMNYGTYEVEKGCRIDTGFNLYSGETVANMMKNEPNIIPLLTEKQKEKIAKDELWNRKHLVSAMTQGILQGESIPKIAERLGRVANMDYNAAIRNARTYTTAAQNKGRMDSYERMDKLGIQVGKKWIATLDERTRMEHRHLDGMVVPYKDVFETDGEKIMFPGDPTASPGMIYNCRCTLVADIPGIQYQDERYDEKLGDMTYEEWKHAKDKSVEEVKGEQKEEKKWIEDVDFVPAKSIEEAEQYVGQFVDKSLFNLTGKSISYDGISLEMANKINARLAEIYKNFDIPKMKSFESYGKKNRKLFKQHAEAGMLTTNFGNIGLNQEIVGSVEKLEKYNQDAAKSWEYVKNNLDALSGSKREMAEIYLNAGRSLVGDSVEDFITHEIGHHISFSDKEANKAFHDIGKGNDWKEYAKGISGYANTKFDEYIAESFNAYYRGETDILQPEMIKVFEGLRRG